VATELAPAVSKLLQSSLPSSLTMYCRAWSLFSQFVHVILPNSSAYLPISPSVMALFIAYLYDRHYVSSAFGYSHWLAGLPDPTKALKGPKKGCGKLGSQLDSRLPTTLSILLGILASSSHICSTKNHINFWIIISFVFTIATIFARN